MAQLLIPQADSAGGLLVPKYEEFTNQGAAPAAPAAGKTRLYVDSNGLMQLLPATGGARRIATLDLPVAQLHQVNGQSIAAATWTSITMDATGVDIDTHGGWAAATPSRWTCPTGQGGTYRVGGVATVQGVAAAAYGGSRIAKNGVAVQGSASLGQGSSASSGVMIPSNPVTLVLAPSDYIELQGYCSSANWTTRVTGPSDGLTSALTIERIR